MGRALCLFGGAFNPPHRTHERVLRAALAQLPVRGALVLPAGAHPHKRDLELAPAAQRLELCRLAFGQIPGVTVDDRELRRAGPSYSVDTVARILEEEPGPPPFWLLVADNVTLLPSWHRHHDLLRLVRPVLVPRFGFALDESSLQGLDFTATERAALLGQVLELEPDDLSASDLRARLATGKDTTQDLHPEVRARIEALGLYGYKR